MVERIAGRYEVVAEHGGGQGRVLEAIDTRHGRRVAIKVRPRSEAALAEAQALLRIAPHPSLPVAREDFFIGDEYFLVTDWVEGTSLAGRTLTLSDALVVARQLADALDHLHTNDPPIVHGDVKPANVILDDRGRAVLVDLGLVGHGGAHGTPGFVAPEVAAGATPTTAADVYGLAATIFTVLTGGLPAAGSGSLDGTLLAAIRAGLATDPARRPVSASSLFESLLAASTAELPDGAVSFLFTDVQGSTRLWEERAPIMARALADHDAVMAAVVAAHGGRLLKSKGEGDSTVSVFPSSAAALDAAVDAQVHLAGAVAAFGIELKVRMAVHTGAAELRDGDYFGPTLNRAARLRGVAHGGQIVVSEAAAQASGRGDLVDLGVHRLRDLSRAERVFQVGHAEFPPLLSLADRRTNLPSLATSFVGREAELARVAELLELSRLVTLTGAGGSGKTRLAIQAAADVLDHFPDGVWLVELAPVTEPGVVAATVAAAAHVTVPPMTPVATAIVDAFEDRTALLLIDNCEHVVDAVADLVQVVLDGCPHVRILATSRERLRLPAETLWPVPVLNLPAEGGAPADSEAVQLFVARARAARPDFSLDDATFAAVVEICRRVDGIPLAIELAAARVGSLPPTELARRLDDVFGLLTGGSRTVLPRQRSLRAMIDWSYDLLTPLEQRTLRRLAVFRGGWTLEAAENVVGEPGVLDALTGLVDKSLVMMDGRYRMLETVREYALERLTDAGERDEWQRRLAVEADRFATSLWDRRAQLNGALIREAAAESANLTAALAWALDHDVELAGRVYGRTGGLMFGRSEEALHWSRQVADKAAAMSDATRCLALTWTVQTLGYAGEVEVAMRALDEALVAGRASGDPTALGYATMFGGAVHRMLQHVEEARALLPESLALAERSQDPLLLGLSLIRNAWLRHDMGDAVGDQEMYVRARCVAEEHGNTFLLEAVLADELERAWADLDKRAALLDQLAAAREDLFGRQPVQTMVDLGNLASSRADVDGAISWFEQALATGEIVHVRQSLYISDDLAQCYHLKGRDRDALAVLAPWLEGKRQAVGADLLRLRRSKAVFQYSLGETEEARAEVVGLLRSLVDFVPEDIYGRGEHRRRWAVVLTVCALAPMKVDDGDPTAAARLLSAWSTLGDDINAVNLLHADIDRTRARIDARIVAQEAAWANARSLDQILAYALEVAETR